jgi:hypothetical protein
VPLHLRQLHQQRRCADRPRPPALAGVPSVVVYKYSDMLCAAQTKGVEKPHSSGGHSLQL